MTNDCKICGERFCPHTERARQTGEIAKTLMAHVALSLQWLVDQKAGDEVMKAWAEWSDREFEG